MERETKINERLLVKGTLPNWLRGSLVHLAPSKFNYGNDWIEWGGGAAMLFKLTFQNDGRNPTFVLFQSSLLDSFVLVE